MTELMPIVVGALAFCAMGGVVYVVGQYFLRAAHLSRRLPAPQGASLQLDAAIESGLAGVISRHFDEKRFGVDEAKRGRLRLMLVQAGYFRREAIKFYVFWRMAAVVLVPLVIFIGLSLFVPYATPSKVLLGAALGAVLGVIVPDAYIARRQRLVAGDYRIAFPDLLDLLVVCVDAGLSLEGALDRVSGEIAKRSRSLGMNLMVMEAEMRAGRSFVDALGSLADRLVIPEARSLVALLRQSIELGTDVGDALRVFSDELREKRLLRAEEQANKLGVKMVFPLGLFIFPVILLVVMYPVMIRLIEAFHIYGNATGH